MAHAVSVCHAAAMVTMARNAVIVAAEAEEVVDRQGRPTETFDQHDQHL